MVTGLNKLLIENHSYLVHCLKFHSEDSPITKRIKAIATNRIDPPFSACTITSGDIPSTNFYGPLGLIIKPGTVLLSGPEDCGSEYINGQLSFDQAICLADPGIKDVELAIKNKNGYNEFVLDTSDYEVLGVFSATTFRKNLMEGCIGGPSEFMDCLASLELPLYLFDKNQGMAEASISNDEFVVKPNSFTLPEHFYS